MHYVINGTGDYDEDAVCFNPNSGKAQIKNQLMKIIQVFSKAGYEITVYPTKASA